MEKFYGSFNYPKKIVYMNYSKFNWFTSSVNFCEISDFIVDIIMTAIKCLKFSEQSLYGTVNRTGQI